VKNDNLNQALAEALFRQAARELTAAKPKTVSAINRLRQAANFSPHEARFYYYLGAIHHRQGELKKAAEAYQQALRREPGHQRAAFMLAFLRLEQNQNLDGDPSWHLLDEEQKKFLTFLCDLSNGRPTRVEQATLDGPANRFWRAMILFASEDPSARQALDDLVDDEHLPGVAQAVVHYCQGVLSHRVGDEQAAQEKWWKAWQKGLSTSSLRANLHPLSLAEAEAQAAAGNWDAAAQTAELAHRLVSTDQRTAHLLSLAYSWQGYQAARRGEWTKARSSFESARRVGETSRELAINLALACEQLEDWQAAAAAWREVLRRRPRKADAPDALTTEQVSHLWQHISQCHSRANDLEGAISALKQAIKYQPGDIALRLSLVELYQSSSRWQGAQFELERILEIAPKHVEALTLLARLETNQGWIYQAWSRWLEILKVDPSHGEARHNVEKLTLELAERYWRGGSIREAQTMFQKALQFLPNNGRLLAGVAEHLVLQGKIGEARKQFEQAFLAEPGNLKLYHIAVDVWHGNGYPEEAEKTIKRAAELAGPLPPDFFIDLASCCFFREEEEQAFNYIGRAEALALNDPEVYLAIGKLLIRYRGADEAKDHFQKAVDLAPDNGQIQFYYALCLSALGHMRLARLHGRRAMAIARRSNDVQLEKTVKEFLEGLSLAPSFFKFFRGFEFPFFPFEEFDEEDYNGGL